MDKATQPGTSLVVQLLRLRFHCPLQGAWALSLVGELRSVKCRDLPKEKDTTAKYIPKIKQVTGTITYEVKKQHEIVESGSLYFDKGTLHWSYKS